ncbi:MAG: amidohydrolase [Actinomycetota bacterium]|nr:amidohydrolase [Actinomycetota bacterium]MDP9477799.1 amidohydrolase [Actinomycetota bacterium]
MRVALAQIDCLLGDVDENLRRAQDVLARAKNEGVDLLVFPELSLAGYALEELGDEVAIQAQSRPIISLAEEAGETTVVVGFCEEGRGFHTYNSVAYLEGGSLLHLHRKLYLPNYRIYEERKLYNPGQSMRAFDTRYGRMAMLICNDAWQPFLPFIAVQDGAQLLIIPANSGFYPHPQLLDTKEYWRDITRFYARMLQSYVIFVNRVGQEGDLTFTGHSHAVDPWGRVVAEGPGGEEALITVDIDLGDVRRRRREVPLVKEARLALLSKELNRLAEEGGDL